MKCMEHVKSNHQLATKPRIYPQIYHGWLTRQDTLPDRYPSVRQPLLPTSRGLLSLIGENAGLAGIEIDNNQYTLQAGNSDSNNLKPGC